MNEKAIDLKIDEAMRARFSALAAIMESYKGGKMARVEFQRRLRQLGYLESFIEETL